jgi:hypothetical protein
LHSTRTCSPEAFGYRLAIGFGAVINSTVGNSGNSQAPHLHLQLMNAPSGLASNGIPYVFDAFLVTAVNKAGTADFDRAEATGSPLTLTLRTPTYSKRFSITCPSSIGATETRVEPSHVVFGAEQ